MEYINLASKELNIIDKIDILREEVQRNAVNINENYKDRLLGNLLLENYSRKLQDASITITMLKKF